MHTRRGPRFRARYSARGWVLCLCRKCGRDNYVEPHGYTAACKCTVDAWVTHESIPFRFGDGHINVTAAREAQRAALSGGAR